MDRISDSDSEDAGSIPAGATSPANALAKAGFFKNVVTMFYAYVIRSIDFKYFYKGHCENLQQRLKQHNAGMTESIRKYIPFEIAYYEEFPTEVEAIVRRKYFKTAACRRYLKSKTWIGSVFQCPPDRT